MTTVSQQRASAGRPSHAVEEHFIRDEPFYLPAADEIELFATAYREHIPVLLKGPTGTGKSRFVEYMAWSLGQTGDSVPLVTVACHEDLTASDLVGRFLIDAAGTRWVDGPLTRAVKAGGICYLDEVVEARKDTTVIIHPLTDHRRTLTIDKLASVIHAAPGFMMVMSYNPGYQGALKELKHSTRQRFIAIELGFPGVEREAEIITHESGVDRETAKRLATLGQKVRNLRQHGLSEGVSTRLLIYAGRLIARGVAPTRACEVSVSAGLTDDVELCRSIHEVVKVIFPSP